MNGYRLVLASDILDRDGLGIELHDSSGRQVAEVFRDDESGARTFTTTGAATLELAVLSWFLANADERL